MSVSAYRNSIGQIVLSDASTRRSATLVAKTLAIASVPYNTGLGLERLLNWDLARILFTEQSRAVIYAVSTDGALIGSEAIAISNMGNVTVRTVKDGTFTTRSTPLSPDQVLANVTNYSWKLIDQAAFDALVAATAPKPVVSPKTVAAAKAVKAKTSKAAAPAKKLVIRNSSLYYNVYTKQVERVVDSFGNIIYTSFHKEPVLGYARSNFRVATADEVNDYLGK